MEVFWKHGYEAAGVQALLDGMKINRGSMYATFGDKRSLFLEAIDHYRKAVVTDLVAMLGAPDAPRRSIRRTLEHVAQRSGGANCRGCMLTNTAVEAAPHDPVVARAVRDALGTIERAFLRALERARDQGEIGSDVNLRSSARLLLGVMQGLVVMGKAGMSQPTMQDVIETTLRSLD